MMMMMMMMSTNLSILKFHTERRGLVVSNTLYPGIEIQLNGQLTWLFFVFRGLSWQTER
jgi:hypothetical protein